MFEVVYVEYIVAFGSTTEKIFWYPCVQFIINDIFSPVWKEPSPTLRYSFEAKLKESSIKTKFSLLAVAVGYRLKRPKTTLETSNSKAKRRTNRDILCQSRGLLAIF